MIQGGGEGRFSFSRWVILASRPAGVLRPILSMKLSDCSFSLGVRAWVVDKVGFPPPEGRRGTGGFFRALPFSLFSSLFYNGC